MTIQASHQVWRQCNQKARRAPEANASRRARARELKTHAAESALEVVSVISESGAVSLHEPIYNPTLSLAEFLFQRVTDDMMIP